jgi:hypothetical protein
MSKMEKRIKATSKKWDQNIERKELKGLNKTISFIEFYRKAAGIFERTHIALGRKRCFIENSRSTVNPKLNF